MIINNFHIMCFTVTPSKAYSSLVVDADAVLAFSVACQLLKPISSGHAKIIQRRGRVQHEQFPQGGPLQFFVEF
jgi:hypothetical protein